jgi:tetratricopeptide (TPR) repeat protein
MARFKKRQLARAVAVALWLAPPALAQDDAELDALFAQLAEPGREDWERIESEITRIWSKSGSPAMDLLLKRGNEALEAEDYPAAVEHFSALIDHAPDFAEGWNARATAYYLMGEYSLSIADVEHVLALNPRHFGALAGLAYMLEALGEPELALKALHAAQALNPNRPNINDAAARLERMTGDAEL